MNETPNVLQRTGAGRFGFMSNSFYNIIRPVKRISVNYNLPIASICARRDE
jgi:hypothetical protein